ncbi:MAG: helix-turn-helix domain-containing protein [Candidatus Woesearchaeota archaeon]
MTKKTTLITREESQKELYRKNPDFKKEAEREDPLFNLRQNILKLRINEGLSQTQLAELVGTKQSVISRLESGSCEPKLTTIKKIANALDKNLKIEIN